MFVGEEHDDDAAERAASEARATAWARKVADRIPTGWIITGTGAVLLGATAAFGGLEPAPQPTPEQLSAGDSYVGSDLEFVILGAEVTGHYKPSPLAYSEACRLLGLWPEQSMLVAAHNNDLAAARD